MKSPDALYEKFKRIANEGNTKEAIGALEMLIAVWPDYALAHNDLGVMYFKEGEKERSLQHYEQAVQLEPENLTFQKNLADFYFVEQGRVQEAMEIYIKVLRENPTDIELLLTLGQVCVSQNKLSDAQVFYNKVLELEPWNRNARERLDEIRDGRRSEDGGQRSEDRGRRSEGGDQKSEVGGWKTEDRGRRSEVSIRNYEDLRQAVGRVDQGFESAEEMYRNAQDEIENGREQGGIDTLEKLLRSYPDFTIAHNDLGVLYFRQGKKQKALEHYERAAKLEPYNDVFQKNLADFFYIEAGRMEEALQIYVKILEMNPTDIETLQTLGKICLSLKKPDDARVFFNKVLEFEPWNLDVMNRLDELERGQGSEIGGRRTEDRWQMADDRGLTSEVGGQKSEDGGWGAGAGDPWMRDGWMDELKTEDGGRKTESRGQTLDDGWMKGWVDDATEGRGQRSEVGGQNSEVGGRRSEDRYQRSDVRLYGEQVRSPWAIEQSGGSAEGLYKKAQGLLNSDRKQEAMEELEKLVAVYPDYALAHNDLGALCFQEGDKQKTQIHYEKAAALEPRNAVFQRNLADFYYVILGRTEEALAIYKKVLELNPEDMEALTILGHICVALKDFDSAKLFYNRALDVEPWNLDVQEKLDQVIRADSVEATGRMQEDGGRKTEDGGQRSEVGGQKTEDRGQRSEVGGQKTEDRGQRSEVGGQKTEDGDQWPVVNAQVSMQEQIDVTASYKAPGVGEDVKRDAQRFVVSLVLSSENSERLIRDTDSGALLGIGEEMEIVVGGKGSNQGGKNDIQNFQQPSRNILYIQTGEEFPQPSIDALSLAAKIFNENMEEDYLTKKLPKTEFLESGATLDADHTKRFFSLFRYISDALKTSAGALLNADRPVEETTVKKGDAVEKQEETSKKNENLRENILKRIVKMKDEDGLGWKEIAEAFNAEGLPTFSGKGQWHRKTIYKMYQKVA